MGIFGTRSNKKFNYTPRYLDSDANPYEIKHKFDDFRKTVGNNNGLKTKINVRSNSDGSGGCGSGDER